MPNVALCGVAPCADLRESEQARAVTYPGNEPSGDRLRHGEAHFRAVYEQAAIGIAVVDASARFVDVNPCLCDLLGYAASELLQLSEPHVTHPDDRARQAEHMARVLTGHDNSNSTEIRFIRKDGAILWSRVTLSAIKDEAGTPTRCVKLVEDISERLRAESALRESETRFARITAHVPGMIYEFVRHPDGTFELPYVSEGSRELIGLAAEDIQSLALSLIDRVYPDDRASWDQTVAESAATLSDWHWTGRVILPSGEIKWVEGASRPERRADGSVVWNGILVDVTERRRAAERLEESEQRYRSLFDQHPDAVFELDHDGVFVSANPACEAISGYSPAELRGQAFAPFVLPEFAALTTAHFAHSLAGAAISFETAIRAKNGRRVDIAVTNVPMIVGGTIRGVFGIARDLTTQRELEARLRQAERMEAVGRLAGGVAHDFNNLLTIITSCSQFAVDRVRRDPIAHADIQQVLNAAARATELTRQLLAFGRQQMLQPRWLDVNAQVERVAGMLRRVIGEDIIVLIELEPALWPAMADPGQLEQVIVNLAVNARDAMPNGGTLRLGTGNVTREWLAGAMYRGVEPDHHVALTFEDTGSGIDPAVLPKIFDPFVTTKGPGRGTGLGLSTVYGIVEQSGGHIFVDSTPGVGSRFTVLLPRAEQPPDTRAESSEATRVPRGRESILLVEDDDAVREVVRRMLEVQGYEVTEASTGADAAAALDARNGRVDLLLLDVVMPGQDGRAIAEEIAARWPGIRVMFMSGYTDDEILRRGLMEPGIAFLAKPFTSEHLARAVREALEGPS